MSQTRGGSGHESTTSTPPGTPRWVKVFGIVVAVAILLFVIMLLVGGNHGPGRHMPSGDAGGYTAPIAHVAHQL